MDNIMFITPIVSGLLYRAGGTDQWKWCPLNQKLWRWGMGAVIGLLSWESWIAYLLTIASYYIATNIPYGEKSPLNFLGETGKFFVCGFSFGLASIPSLGIFTGLEQGVLSGLGFIAIKALDDKNILKNPFVEFGRGFLGTLCYLWG